MVNVCNLHADTSPASPIGATGRGDLLDGQRAHSRSCAAAGSMRAQRAKLRAGGRANAGIGFIFQFFHASSYSHPSPNGARQAGRGAVSSNGHAATPSFRQWRLGTVMFQSWLWRLRSRTCQEFRWYVISEPHAVVCAVELESLRMHARGSVVGLPCRCTTRSAVAWSTDRCAVTGGDRADDGRNQRTCHRTCEGRLRAAASMPCPQLDLDDLEDALQSDEIGRIACIKRQSIRRSRRGNEQVREPCPAGLPGCTRGRKNPTVHTCRIRIEGQRIPGGRRPLQAILSSSAFVLIFGCMWTGSEFRQGHRSNCGFIRKSLGNDLVVID